MAGLLLLAHPVSATVEIFAAVKLTNGQGGLPAGSLSAFDEFGHAVASAGDLNGDGVDDLAVGSPRAFSLKGAIGVLFMSSAGTVASTVRISDDVGGLPSSSLEASDAFGEGICSLGDLNSDGVNDLLVGAPGDDDGVVNAGAVWVLFMTTEGSASASQKISNSAGSLGDGTFGALLAASLAAGYLPCCWLPRLLLAFPRFGR
jgi:hypothetical protein